MAVFSPYTNNNIILLKYNINFNKLIIEFIIISSIIRFIIRFIARFIIRFIIWTWSKSSLIRYFISFLFIPNLQCSKNVWGYYSLFTSITESNMIYDNHLCDAFSWVFFHYENLYLLCLHINISLCLCIYHCHHKQTNCQILYSLNC